MAKKNFNILTSIGNNVRKLRTKQDISQNQLAYETGLSREYINKLENGKCNISVTKLKLIADALDVHTSSLLKE